MNDLKNTFDENPVIENYWEEVLKKFPQAQQKEYFASKESEVDLITTEQNFVYSFTLNPKWIIKKQKVSEVDAKWFIDFFYVELSSILSNKLGVTYINTKEKIDFITESSEKLQNLKEHCNFLIEQMPIRLQTLDFKKNGLKMDVVSLLEQLMIKDIEKFVVFESLDKQLEKKSENITKKPKI